MSRWILQSAASDSDPISFEQLAQMLADGVVEEMDLVRPEQSTHWQPVDGVVGLCRAADRLRRTSSPDGVAALEMLADGTDSDGIQGDAADSLSAEILQR